MPSIRLNPSILPIALLIFGLGLPGVVSANTGDDLEKVRETAAISSLSGSFLAAQIAAKANDDEAAVEFYRRSLSLDPDNDNLKQMLFLALSANGRIIEAVELARENLLRADGPGFARVVVAVDALKRKSFSQVLDIIDEESGAELDGLIDKLIVAWAQFGKGDTALALQLARKNDGPEWVGVIRNFHAGLMAAASGDDKTAVELFSAAIENTSIAAVLTETYLRSVEGLVHAQARSGDLDSARATLADGLQLLSAHPPFLALRDKLESGTPLTPIVKSASQGVAELFYNVGGAISRQNGAPFAQSYLQLASFLHPESDFIAMALANLFENQKAHARANRYYETIREDSAYYRRSRLEYALNLNDLEQANEAEEVLRGLIEEDPEDLLVYTTLGGVLSQHEKYEEATKIYDAAVERIDEPDESHWNLFYRRGIAYERIKQWEKAEPNFRKSLDLSPDQADVLNYLGYSLVDMGIKLEEGMDMIRKAVDLKPRSGFIVDSLGWAHYKLGEYEKAVRELERAVEIMPEDPVINDHLGDAYWKVGRKLEATFQWKHALAFDPELEEKIKIRAKLLRGLEEKPATSAATE